MTVHPFPTNPLAGAGEIRTASRWFLALGILFIVFGVLCVISDVSATFATVLVFGWLLALSGAFGLVHAFRTHSTSRFLLSLLSALLRGFTGYLLIRYPLAGAVSLTLILASFFVVGGLFRAISAAMMKFPGWGWAVVSGALSLMLGILLLAESPLSSIWFIGFAIGLDLIVEGASLIRFATAIHSQPELSEFDKAA